MTDRSTGGWEPGEYERLAGIAVAAVARYVEESQAGETPVGSPPPLADLVEELELRTLVRRGGMDADRFEEWLGRMLARAPRLHHPAQVAHQVGAPDVRPRSRTWSRARSTSLCPSTRWARRHAAERVVVEWMAEKLGWETGPAECSRTADRWRT